MTEDATPRESLFFVSGGTLPPETESYIEREADRVLLAKLSAGRFCYVLNSRQMGKSSLCVRTMKRLQESGANTSFVDLTKIGGKNVTAEQWYAGVVMDIGRSLNLRQEFLQFWKENQHLSPVQRLFEAIREVALAKANGSLVIFIDEIDATRSLPFSCDEFFASIRECYNRRVQDPVFERLTFCLLGVAVPSDLINSPTSTPFNIGERIYLRDFTPEECTPFAQGIGGDRNASDLVKRVVHWTGGQPYLTQSLCAAVAADVTIRTTDDVDDLISRDLFAPTARETNINLADVGNRALMAGELEAEPEKFKSDLLSAYLRVWHGKPMADDEANRVAALLKMSGILRSESNRLVVRNRIYHEVFNKAWVASNMPRQEVRRQKSAFRIGVLRTAVVALLFVGLLSRLLWTERVRADEARLAKQKQDHELYIARMNSLQLFAQENDPVPMRELLAQTKDSPYRGWEWGYWNQIVHSAPEEYALKGNKDAVAGLFSEDGTQLLITGDKGRSVVYDRRKKAVLWRKSSTSGNETLLRFAGRWILQSESQDGHSAKLLDLLNGAEVYSAHVDSGYLTLNPVRGTHFVWSESSETLTQKIVQITDFVTHEVAWRQVTKGETFYPLGGTGPWVMLASIPQEGSSFYTEILVDMRTGKVVDKVNLPIFVFIGAISTSGRQWAFSSGNSVIVRCKGANGYFSRPLYTSPHGPPIPVGFDQSEHIVWLRCPQEGVIAVDTETGSVVKRYPLATTAEYCAASGELCIGGSSVQIVQPKIEPTRTRGSKALAFGNKDVPMATKWLSHDADHPISLNGKIALVSDTKPMIHEFTDPGLLPLPEVKPPNGSGWHTLSPFEHVWQRTTEAGNVQISEGDARKSVQIPGKGVGTVPTTIGDRIYQVTYGVKAITAYSFRTGKEV